MSFAFPLALAVGAAATAALWAFLRRADAARRRDLEQIASPQLLAELQASVAPRRRTVKRSLLLLGVALAFVAVAGPQVGFDWQETKRRGIDVLVAIDVSRSMLARDVNPDRMQRAKLAVADLLEKLGGDRVGLIAFAGTAFLQCPLTLDHAAFLESLDALEPGIIPAPGTDLASALRVARDALRSEGTNVKLVVLFSDGEDLGNDALAAAREIAADGVKLYTVGVGSSSGELIPIPKEGGGTGFLKDPSGQFVKSRLDEAMLRQVAEATGGFYAPLGQRGQGVDEVYEKALQPIPRQELASRMRRVPRDRFQVPLALAIACLVAELALRDRRGAARQARRAAARVAATALLLGSLARGALASPQSAARLYDAGHYAEALADYEAASKDAPDNAKLDFNLGAAAYRAGKLDTAAGAFARSLRDPDPSVQERAFFNLGNAQYRIGQQSVQTAPDKTMQSWEQALQAYESALKLDERDADAKYNRDLVKQALEELKQQQQQQQKGGQKNDEKRDKKNDDKSEQQPSSDGGAPPPQDQQGQQERQAQNQPSAGGEPKPGEQTAPTPTPGDASRSGQPQGEPSAEPRPAPSAAPQPQASPGDASRQASGAEGTPRGGASPAPAAAAADTAPRGEMSAADARQLLDSLKSEERQIPFLSAPPRKPAPDQPTRDW